MPTFLKVSNKTINLDHVFEIDDYGDRIRVYYAVTSSDTTGTQQPSYTELEGVAAEALRGWIAAHVTDIGAALQADQPRSEAPTSP